MTIEMLDEKGKERLKDIIPMCLQQGPPPEHNRRYCKYEQQQGIDQEADLQILQGLQDLLEIAPVPVYQKRKEPDTYNYTYNIEYLLFIHGHNYGK